MNKIYLTLALIIGVRKNIEKLIFKPYLRLFKPSVLCLINLNEMTSVI